MSEKISVDYRQGDVDFSNVKFSGDTYTAQSTDQSVDVVIADGRGADGKGRDLIWPTSFYTRGDDVFEWQRIGTLAARFGARVTQVGLPNLSWHDSGHLNLNQALTLPFGNYDAHAKPQLEALDSALDFKSLDEVGFIGYSLGVWSAFSMAKLLGQEYLGSDKRPEISSLTAIETVNDENWRAVELARAINGENVDFNRYFFDENGERGFKYPLRPADRSKEEKRFRGKMDLKQIVDIWLPAAGLRRGFADTLPEMLEESQSTTRLAEADITFVRGNRSQVARADANERTVGIINETQKRTLANQARLLTAESPEQDGGHGHHFVASYGNVAHLAAARQFDHLRVA